MSFHRLVFFANNRLKYASSEAGNVWDGGLKHSNRLGCVLREASVSYLQLLGGDLT